MTSIDWSQHPHMSPPRQQNCDHFSLSPAFTHSNQLQSTQLICLWVDIHVGVLYTIALIVDEWVGRG